MFLVILLFISMLQNSHTRDNEYDIDDDEYDNFHILFFTRRLIEDTQTETSTELTEEDFY